MHSSPSSFRSRASSSTSRRGSSCGSAWRRRWRRFTTCSRCWGPSYTLDKEITLLVVTALLTLAGYSLTDTVVVFDRISENLRLRRREHEETMINNAINQVLSRTIVTSLTVVLVLIPLTLAGGEVLHDFSLALLWGVIFGTYSSVFVASPLLLLWPGGPDGS